MFFLELPRTQARRIIEILNRKSQTFHKHCRKIGKHFIKNTRTNQHLEIQKQPYHRKLVEKKIYFNIIKSFTFNTGVICPGFCFGECLKVFRT